MILPVESKEISRRLRQYLPEFARPLLDRLIERVRYETQQEIALTQEQRRRGEAAAQQAEPRTYTRTYVFEPITQNVLSEAGQDVKIVTAREQAELAALGAPLGLATAPPIADARPAARRLEYDDRIAFIVEHLAGPRPDLADLEDRQRAREELIQAAEQAD